MARRVSCPLDPDLEMRPSMTEFTDSKETPHPMS